MTAIIDLRLLDLLACPRCGGQLGSGDYTLACFSCGTSYEVRGGIPLLFPDGIDLEHLEEEEKLGELMADAPESARDALSEEQWEISKMEFWDFVRAKLGTGKTVVNVGCGIDAGFLDLSSDNTVVALDLMCPLLERLRDGHGSELNVAGAVQALPLSDGTFDAVFCIDLIHHEPERLLQIFGSLARVLGPGGMLFLEDINAWGMLQFWKSKLMPRRLHGALRDLWHTFRRSGHRPAPYEFPTDVFRTKRLLAEEGFKDIETLPLLSYPNTGKTGLALYRSFARFERVRRYHNFHYMIYARKA